MVNVENVIFVRFCLPAGYRTSRPILTLWLSVVFRGLFWVLAYPHIYVMVNTVTGGSSSGYLRQNKRASTVLHGHGTPLVRTRHDAINPPLLVFPSFAFYDRPLPSLSSVHTIDQPRRQIAPQRGRTKTKQKRDGGGGRAAHQHPLFIMRNNAEPHYKQQHVNILGQWKLLAGLAGALGTKRRRQRALWRFPWCCGKTNARTNTARGSSQERAAELLRRPHATLTANTALFHYYKRNRVGSTDPSILDVSGHVFRS